MVLHVRNQDLGSLVNYSGTEIEKKQHLRITLFLVAGFFLRSGSHLPKKIGLFASLKSLLRMMKNAFYVILKGLFVLKIFKFLSLIFGHVAKTAS